MKSEMKWMNNEKRNKTKKEERKDMKKNNSSVFRLQLITIIICIMCYRLCLTFQRQFFVLGKSNIHISGCALLSDIGRSFQYPNTHLYLLQ